MTTGIERINQAAGLIVPEIILIATVCVMFLGGAFLVSERGQTEAGLRHRWGIFSLLALALAGWVWFGLEPQSVSGGPFRVDALTCYIRGLTLFFGALLTLLLWNQVDDAHAAEAHACLLAILAGTNLTIAANDLVILFLGLELVSIPTYVLLYLGRTGSHPREATIKYFLLSIFAGAMTLYGMSWLFGAAGTTNLSGIASALKSQAGVESSGFLQLALALVMAGLSFRIAAVPFHFYAPDVFQGTSSSLAAMLSFLPKIVGFAALLRLIPLICGAATLAEWSADGTTKTFISVLAIVTMFVGNLLALRQTNLHRLLAYSAVAHAGYLLVGFAVGSQGAAVSGVSALLFYLPVYGLMTIGAFALIACAGTAQQPLLTISDLSGLGRTQPAAAFLLTACLFSLTGMPPTAGLLGKLNLFLAGWSEGTTTGQVLAIFLAVNALIAAWYYLRLVAVMYLEPASGRVPHVLEPASAVAGVFCSVATFGLFFVPQWLWDAALKAVS